MINPFTKFDRTILKPLMQMWATVRSLDNMRGDGFINIKRSNAGTTIGLNLTEARKRIAKKQDTNRQAIFQVRSWAEETLEDATTSGLYNCVELKLNESGSFYKVVDPDGFTPYEGVTSGLGHDDYEEWSSITNYLIGDIVEVTTEQISDNDKDVVRVYKAIEDNTNKPPASNPDEWKDLTVTVLNLSETYPAITYVSESIKPKLGNTDLIQASFHAGPAGSGMWAGIDASDNVRLFKIKGGVSGDTSTALADMLYGDVASSDLVIAQDGQLNFDVPLQNNWVGSTYNFTDETVFTAAHWVKGVWFMNPYLIPTIGSGMSISGITITVP